MQPINRAGIEAARERIAPHIRTTPTLSLERGAFSLQGFLVLKLELMQHTGSFKARGAFNRILSCDVDHAGVVAASGGNFGVAVAYAAAKLDLPAEVFVPDTSSPVKVERLHALGADVQVVRGFYADALAASEQRAAKTGALFMHAYDQPEVVAGQGTVAAELSRQTQAVDTVLVAVGGGGLIGGVASWFAGDVRVVGVEPVRAPTLTRALEAGMPIDVEVSGLAADSLGARRAGSIGFAAARSFVERTILVEDVAIADAQRMLWHETRIVAEPGGAAALAALTSGAYRPAADEWVAVLVCGGNTDPALLSSGERLGSPALP